MESNSNTPLTTILIWLALSSFLVAGCGHAQSSDDPKFEEGIESFNCQKSINAEGFNLAILGRKFPLTKGFEFYGVSQGEALFGKKLDLSQANDSSELSVQLQRKAELRTDVYYSPNRKSDNYRQMLPTFEEINWEGLTIFYDVSVVGRAVPLTVHQALILAKEGPGELRINSGSKEAILEMIACSISPTE